MKDVDTIIKHVSWEEYYTLTDKKAWTKISKQGNLSEKFIDEFARKLNWNLVCECQTLSEYLMRKYHNFINWSYVCSMQILSEQFIEDFKHVVDWELVFEHQKLSDEFKAKHQWRIKLINYYRKCLLNKIWSKYKKYVKTI